MTHSITFKTVSVNTGSESITQRFQLSGSRKIQVRELLEKRSIIGHSKARTYVATSSKPFIVTLSTRSNLSSVNGTIRVLVASEQRGDYTVEVYRAGTLVYI